MHTRRKSLRDQFQGGSLLNNFSHVLRVMLYHGGSLFLSLSLSLSLLLSFFPSLFLFFERLPRSFAGPSKRGNALLLRAQE